MSTGSPQGGPADAALHTFLLALGGALSRAGVAVSEIQERLDLVATSNGASRARIVVLPTALIVSLGRGEPASVESIPQVDGAWRLDQISALFELMALAEHGKISPADGLDKLDEIRAAKPRNGRIVAVIAHSVMAVGICLILQPTPRDLAATAVLGLLVGILVVATNGRPTLAPLVPIMAATMVSALSFEAVKHGVTGPDLRTLIAPLVIFLPGSALTTATVELASGEMVAGASRLVFGFVQLLLLAFGIVAGTALVGLPSESVLSDDPANLLGWWAPWLGVMVFGCAVAVYFSAPRGATKWLLIVLLAAWTGQLAGDALFGPGLSGFVGALLMTPIALAIARLPSGPPAQVTFLPAFWLLVPGAIGLIGVTAIVSNPAAAGTGTLIDPLGSIASIALGVLCGVSLFRAVSAPRALLRKPGSAR